MEKKFWILADSDGDHVDCDRHSTKAEAVTSAEKRIRRYEDSEGYYILEAVSYVGKPKAPVQVLDL